MYKNNKMVGLDNEWFNGYFCGMLVLTLFNVISSVILNNELLLICAGGSTTGLYLAFIIITWLK